MWLVGESEGGVHARIPKAVYAFGAVCMGFVLARHALQGDVSSTLLLSIASGLLMVTSLTSGRTSRATLMAAAIAFGAGWYALRIDENVRARTHAAPEAGAAMRVRGLVTDGPRITSAARHPLAPRIQPQGDAVRWVVSVRAIESHAGWATTTGELLVFHPARTDTVNVPPRVGQMVVITGLFSPPRAPLNPGEHDAREFSAQAGRLGSLRLSDASLMQAWSDQTWSAQATLRDRLASWLHRVQSVVSDRARRALLGASAELPSEAMDPARALLAALILGEEERSLEETRASFSRLGIVHVLSISGFHISVLSILAVLVLRLTGDHGWVEPAIVSVLLVVYLAILPVNAPVWRSGIMVLALLTADALGRRYHPLAILSWIALGLALWRPLDVFTLGFQLSFLLTAAIVHVSPRTIAQLFGPAVRGVERRIAPSLTKVFLARAASLLVTSLLCWLIATPVVLYHTGWVSVLGILSSILLTPLLSLLVGVAYLVLFVGLVVPPLADPAADFVWHLAQGCLWITSRLDGLALACYLPKVSIVWTLVATIAAWWLLTRASLRDRVAGVSLAAISLWLAAELWYGPRVPYTVPVRIDTLAVGDGTCHLIRSGSHAMLWDCGSLSPGVGKRLVPRALRSIGAWRIPTAVITHPNLDHFNGLIDIAELIGLREVLIADAFAQAARRHPDGPEAYVLDQLVELQIEVVSIDEGHVHRLGDATVSFLSPPLNPGWRESNDHSLVAIIAHPQTAASALLCGDIQQPAMDHVRARHPALRPAVIEAPHHGSYTDTALSFLRELDPAIVIQSTGASRARDPRWTAIQARSKWLCTAVDGATTVDLRRDGSVRFASFRDP